MRRYKLSESDVELIVADFQRVERDPGGNALYYARRRGQLYRVVIAGDDPDYVITVHERRK
jgi:hypothetical protein